MNRLFLFVLLALTVFTAACSDDDTATSPVSRSGRLFGFDFVDTAEGGNYMSNLQIATNMGVNHTTLHIPWTLIETGAGSGTNSGTLTDPYSGALATYNGLCAATGLKLSLTIRPVDLTGKTVPSDLSSMSFSNETMIVRFCKVADYIFSLIDYTHLTSLQIGNEIDFYNPLGDGDSTFWTDYPVFLSSVNAYLTNKYPGLRAGFTVTFEGATGPHSSRYRQWAALLGRIGVTYYPNQSGGFQVKTPQDAVNDLTSLCAAYPDVAVFLQEVGYQTATACSSTPALQADFISKLFTFWDTQITRIPVLNFTRLYDYSPEHATNVAGGYGLSDFAFIEYLRTLGLAEYPAAGNVKPGLSELSNQLRNRGW